MLAVSDIVARFYKVDENAVIWLSTIVHVFQFILELPTAFLSTRISLRNFIIIGCSLNFIGSGKLSNIGWIQTLFLFWFFKVWILGFRLNHQISNRKWARVREIEITWPADFREKSILLKTYAWIKSFLKIVFENLPVTWPQFLVSWFILDDKSDDINEIQKFKLFGIYRNKVWIQPLFSKVAQREVILKFILSSEKLWFSSRFVLVGISRTNYFTTILVIYDQ